LKSPGGAEHHKSLELHRVKAFTLLAKGQQFIKRKKILRFIIFLKIIPTFASSKTEKMNFTINHHHHKMLIPME